MMELISCIIPINKDHGHFDESLSSILEQSYSKLEVIIIANNCSDDLWEKIQSIKDERVKSFRTPIGQIPFALNMAIHNAKGNYIARMDADDIAHPERFSKQIQYFQNNPNCDVLGSDYEAIDGEGKPVNYSRRLYVTDSEIKAKLPISNPIYHPTVMFKKSFILKVRGYAYGFYAEDYELWLRARRVGEYHFHNLKEKLIKYRVHNAQATSSSHKRLPFIEEIALRWREFLITKEFKFLIGIFASSKLGRFLIILNNKRKGKVIK